ncbi:NAD-dependent epimerase/dehydratase family protein [Anaerocolumna xylanovorans]|uniref:Nucleoside-diphosphate-sugar epimerase n=1 Tax=Anaerocolumna xylanovorans DSM 12503 TaxID=1121345 RepID=A0A1M7YIP8_9FIRM|nr:NAD-dependent epimerase/dehydratase family protein [Anaerocolumna xylanovorans]SHO52483.1 Nucleoside-diphosphate-sugar epimerase [Anaerocolumna xylanovorans DSM 12503]
MKVFMIGGTGLLGLEGAKELIRRGHEVSSIALPPIPEGVSLPPGMKLFFGNYMELTDEEIRNFMKGCEGFVFAAGVDERVEGPAPIYDTFYRYNIKPLERLLRIAKEVGVKHAVVLGSFFAYFNRIWKGQKLYDTHPYIRSRVDQANMALSFADENMDVSVLELPYIFGTQPGRKPVWVFLIEQISKMKGSTFYPKGGTAMVTVRQVGQCIAGALERGKGGKNYPVGYFNLTWKEMLTIMHKHMGTPDKRIITIPKFLYRLGMRSIINEYKEKGIEPGLDPIGLVEIMTNRAFIDKKIIVEEMGVKGDDIDKAIGESVRLCMEVLDGKQKTISMKGE